MKAANNSMRNVSKTLIHLVSTGPAVTSSLIADMLLEAVHPSSGEGDAASLPPSLSCLSAGKNGEESVQTCLVRKWNTSSLCSVCGGGACTLQWAGGRGFPGNICSVSASNTLLAWLRLHIQRFFFLFPLFFTEIHWITYGMRRAAMFRLSAIK